MQETVRLEPPQPAAGARRVIAVASGKGGVGKTWFAISLAHALADGGRRALLFDGDLGLANIDVQLGLAPAHDLGSVFSGRMALADAISRNELCGFDILTGRSGCGTLAAISADRRSAVVRELSAVATNYDCVVVDLGAGIEQGVRAFAAEATGADPHPSSQLRRRPGCEGHRQVAHRCRCGGDAGWLMRFPALGPAPTHRRARKQPTPRPLAARARAAPSRSLRWKSHRRG